MPPMLFELPHGAADYFLMPAAERRAKMPLRQRRLRYIIVIEAGYAAAR